MEDDNLEHALDAAEMTAVRIANELRQMASGSYEYQNLLLVTPWLRNIWNAAADMIERHDSGTLH